MGKNKNAYSDPVKQNARENVERLDVDGKIILV
jgi:hypothetical protein